MIENLEKENTLLLALFLGYEFKEKTNKYFLLEKNGHKIYFFKTGGKLSNISVGYHHLEKITNFQLYNFENNSLNAVIDKTIKADENLLEEIEESEILNYIFRMISLNSNPFLSNKEYNYIHEMQPFSKLFFLYKNSNIAIPLFSGDFIKDLIIFNKSNVHQLFGINNLSNSTKSIEENGGGYLFYHPYTLIQFLTSHAYNEEENHIIAGRNFQILLNPESTVIYHLNTYLELNYILKYIFLIANSNYSDTGIYFNYFTSVDKAILRINYSIEKIKFVKVTKYFNDILTELRKLVDEKFLKEINLNQNNIFKKNSKFSNIIISGQKNNFLLQSFLTASVNFINSELKINLPNINYLSNE